MQNPQWVKAVCDTYCTWVRSNSRWVTRCFLISPGDFYIFDFPNESDGCLFGKSYYYDYINMMVFQFILVLLKWKNRLESSLKFFASIVLGISHGLHCDVYFFCYWILSCKVHLIIDWDLILDYLRCIKSTYICISCWRIMFNKNPLRDASMKCNNLNNFWVIYIETWKSLKIKLNLMKCIRRKRSWRFLSLLQRYFL